MGDARLPKQILFAHLQSCPAPLANLVPSGTKSPAQIINIFTVAILTGFPVARTENSGVPSFRDRLTWEAILDTCKTNQLLV